MAKLLTGDGTIVCANCEIADTALKRIRGLLGRAGLAPGEGMLFRPAGAIHTVFMRFPIDAVFLGRPDATGQRKVVGLRRALRPWLGVVWYVRGANGVIELPVGAIDASSTSVGDLVSLEEPRAA